MAVHELACLSLYVPHWSVCLCLSLSLCLSVSVSLCVCLSFSLFLTHAQHQVTPEQCVVEGTVDGLSPGQEHQLYVHEYGDLSGGCERLVKGIFGVGGNLNPHPFVSSLFVTLILSMTQLWGLLWHCYRFCAFICEGEVVREFRCEPYLLLFY